MNRHFWFLLCKTPTLEIRLIIPRVSKNTLSYLICFINVLLPHSPAPENWEGGRIPAIAQTKQKQFDHLVLTFGRFPNAFVDLFAVLHLLLLLFTLAKTHFCAEAFSWCRLCQAGCNTSDWPDNSVIMAAWKVLRLLFMGAEV